MRNPMSWALLRPSAKSGLVRRSEFLVGQEPGALGRRDHGVLTHYRAWGLHGPPGSEWASGESADLSWMFWIAAAIAASRLIWSVIAIAR